MKRIAKAEDWKVKLRRRRAETTMEKKGNIFMFSLHVALVVIHEPMRDAEKILLAANSQKSESNYNFRKRVAKTYTEHFSYAS